MTPTVLLISVGISDYNDDEGLGDSDLRYAAADAAWFEGYVAEAWPEATRILLQDAGGTLEAFGVACREGKAMRPDLLLVFLAGHGMLVSKGAAFVTHRGTAAMGGRLDGAALDGLLRVVGARTTVLLLDCCHAEGVVQNCDYFGALEGSDARVFLVSSRLGQRSWEDDATRSGLFTSCIREALRPRLPATTADLEREVFATVRARLPVLVFQQKQGAVQEPLRGGIMAHPVELPLLGQVGPDIRSTPLRAVLLRFRGVLVTAGACLVAALVAIQFVAYHMVFGGERLEIHGGVRALDEILPGFGALRVDTGIPRSDVDQGSVGARALLENRVAGVWSQRDRAAVRYWLGDSVLPLLTASGRFDWEASVYGSVSEVLPMDDPVRTLRALTTAAVLGNQRARELLGPPSGPGLGDIAGAPVGCKPVRFATATRPRSLPPEVLHDEVLAALEAAAVAVDLVPEQGFELFVVLFQNVRAHAHYRESTEEIVEEALALKRVLQAYVRARYGPNGVLEEAASRRLIGLDDGGCAPWGTYVLSDVAPAQLRSDLGARIQAALANLDLSGRSSPNPRQVLALEAATALAAKTGAWPAGFAFGRPLTADETPANWPVDVWRWLERLPRTVQLPEGDRTHARNALVAASARGDSVGAIDALMALSVNLDGATGGEREEMSRTIRRLRPTPIERVRYALLVGRLGQAGIAGVTAVRSLSEWVYSEDAEEIPSHAGGETRLGTDTSLIGYAEALGLAAQGESVPTEGIVALRDVLARAPSYPMTEAYRGLAHQKPYPCGMARATQVEEIRTRLAAWPRDSAQRGVERRMLAAGIQACAPSKRGEVRASVRAAWQEEIEPEVRRELGTLLREIATW